MLVAGLIASAAALAAQDGGVLERVNGDAIDRAFTLRGRDVPRDVVVIAIDNRALDTLPWHWPYPRTAHARIVDRLHAAGVRRIVYDVEFSHPTAGRPQEDLALYEALGRAGGGVLATTETDAAGHSNVLGGDDNLRRIRARAAAAAVDVDRGGVVRRVPLHDGGIPTLAVATARQLGAAVPREAFAGDGAWIDYAGPPGTIPTYSFADVYNGRVAPSALRGRIAVVGATSPLLHDLHSVPTSDHELMSGAEIQANAIHTALAGFPLRSTSPLAGTLLVLLFAALGSLLVLFLRPLYAAAAAVALGAAYALGMQIPFDHGVIVPIVAPLLALAAATWLAVTASYIIERSERGRVVRDNLQLEHAVNERTTELHAAHLEVVRRLAYAVESRDGETGAHVDRMSYLCERLALAVGVPAAEAELIRHASVLHDIGKLSVPDSILLKRGELDVEERDLMRGHAIAGAAILRDSPSPLLQLGEVIARTHHERWDGFGYPAGLRGEEIPLPGRIAAVCDVFDALVAERPYKRGWSIDEAITELLSERGRHFDPALVEAFVGMRDELRRLYTPGGLQQAELAAPAARGASYPLEVNF